ncbi:MAG: hypothetical protein QM769_03250 [Pseudoxanthomonas sp.]
MARLRLRGYEAPYFISYTLRESESHDVVGKLGAVFGQSSDRQRVIHVEVRVGNYDFDNTSADGSDGNADLALSLTEVSKDAPLDDNLEALRGTLWLITDQKYKAALAAYASKRARGVRDVEPEDKLPSFSKEAAQRQILPPPAFPVNLAAMADAVRRIGERVKQAPVRGRRSQAQRQSHEPLLRVQRRRPARRAPHHLRRPSGRPGARQGRHAADQRARLLRPRPDAAPQHGRDGAGDGRPGRRHRAASLPRRPSTPTPARQSSWKKPPACSSTRPWATAWRASAS